MNFVQKLVENAPMHVRKWHSKKFHKDEFFRLSLYYIKAPCYTLTWGFYCCKTFDNKIRTNSINILEESLHKTDNKVYIRQKLLISSLYEKTFAQRSFPL